MTNRSRGRHTCRWVAKVLFIFLIVGLMGLGLWVISVLSTAVSQRWISSWTIYDTFWQLGLTEIPHTHYITRRLIQWLWIIFRSTIGTWSCWIAIQNHEQLGYACKASGLEYYTKLISVLQEIQAKFKCNIVTSSWNNTFEKGHNYSGATDCEATGLDSITFLPQKYLMEFDYLIQKSNGTDTESRIYNKLAGRWIDIA